MKILYPPTQRSDGTEVPRTWYFHAYHCNRCNGLGDIHWFSYDDCEDLEEFRDTCPNCEGWGSHTNGTEVFRDMVFATVMALRDSWTKEKP